MDGQDNEALLATVVTALLIRVGGRFTMPEEEWRGAIKHQSTIWMEKNKEGEVFVALIPKNDVTDA